MLDGWLGRGKNFPAYTPPAFESDWPTESPPPRQSLLPENLDVVVRDLSREKDTLFGRVTRAATKYRFPDAQLESMDAQETPDPAQIIQVLASAALNDSFEEEDGVGGNSRNLLFQYLEKATQDSDIKLPDLALARHWLEAEIDREHLEIQSFRKISNFIPEFRTRLTRLREREHSFLKKLAARQH